MSGDFRADLIPCVDAARKCVEDLGLRTEPVEIVTREFAGFTGLGLPDDGLQLGAGAVTELSRVVIDPRPVVTQPSPRLIASDPGTFERGDRIISKVTRTLDASDFTNEGMGVGAGGEKRERFFEISGESYRMVREPSVENFEWVIHVRRAGVRP